MLEAWTCRCGQRNTGPGPCGACLNPAPAGVGGSVATTGRAAPRRVVVATALAVAVLLVAGVASVWVVGAGEDRGSEGSRSAAFESRTVEVTPDHVPPAGASPLERALPPLLRFVQEARGLPFTRPVEVSLLDDRAFRARLKAASADDEAESTEELRTVQRVLEALGLLDRGNDLDALVEDLYGAAVAGFYDTETDELVVRGERLTVGLRTTLVHELTHALQAQHFDIERDDLDDRADESADAFTGVVEGDAVRIERLYVDSLTVAEQKAAEAEEVAAGAGIGDDIPRIVLQLVLFPYVVGPEFTAAVVEAGGQPRLDAAFREPPTTTEQILHPEVFLRGQAAVPVDPPRADGEVLDEGVLGELVLLLVLNTLGSPQNAAAAGWGGDRYVAWSKGDDTCVRATIAMDTPQDTTQLRRALDRLAEDRDGLVVAGRGPISITSCG